MIIHSIDDILNYKPDYCATPREIAFMLAAEKFIMNHLDDATICEKFHYATLRLLMPADQIEPFNHADFVTEMKYVAEMNA